MEINAFYVLFLWHSERLLQKNQRNLAWHIINLNRMCPQVVLNLTLKFQKVSMFLSVGEVCTKKWSPWANLSKQHQDHHIDQSISSESCYHDVGFPWIPSPLSILAAPVGSEVAYCGNRVPQQPANKEESSPTGHSRTKWICMYFMLMMTLPLWWQLFQ